MQKVRNKFRFRKEDLYLEFEKYDADKSVALVIRDEMGAPYATLSIRITDQAKLEDGEFAIKNYTENEDIAKTVFETGWFEDTGKRVRTGYVEVPIWRFK